MSCDKLMFDNIPISALTRTSPKALAYIGDAVYELYIRSCYLLPAKKLRIIIIKW